MLSLDVIVFKMSGSFIIYTWTCEEFILVHLEHCGSSDNNWEVCDFSCDLSRRKQSGKSPHRKKKISLVTEGHVGN